MSHRTIDFAHVTDEQLLQDIRQLAAREREATAALIASLAELDARRLHVGQGYSSLFVYCTQCLRLSEHAAYGRIEAARAAGRFPIVLELLADGSITLTAVCLLSPHLTAQNHRTVLEAARHKSKREVEQQVAALRPLPDVPSVVRKLPVARLPGPPPRFGSDSGSTSPSTQAFEHARTAPQPQPAIIAPLAPERYKVQLTVSRETHDKLRRVQELVRHNLPNGDPAVIFDRALTLLLEQLEKRKTAATSVQRATSQAHGTSRHIAASVKRDVWARDGGQCAYVGADGRCTERGFLEFHHVVPFAEGGLTTTANLQLRCRAHNAYEAEMHFGPLLFRETSPPLGLGPDRVSGSS